MHVHAQPAFALWALILLALLGGSVGLCVLFCFKRTRMLAVILAVLGILAGGFLWVNDVVEEEMVKGRRAPLAVEMGERAFHEPIDVDKLFQPRIKLHREEHIVADSAHRPHEPQPLETVEGHPPTPHFEHDHATDARSESTPEHARDEAVVAAHGSHNDAERPAWVDESPPRSGDSYPIVVSTEAFANRREADRQMNELITIATAEVVSDLVGSRPWHHPDKFKNHDYRYMRAVEHLRGLGLTPGQIRNEVFRDEYLEHLDLELTSSALPMFRVHTLLEYNEEFQSELQQRWKRHQAHRRLESIGIVAGSVLGLLALVWGVLVFDTATKGYYTKWLLIGGAAATIGVVVLVVS